jgi:hypothetical protein
MFIIFGYSDESKVLDDTEKKVCRFCGNEKQFNLLYRYRSHHFFFLPVHTSGGILSDVCSNCGRGEEITFKQAKERFGRNPVSWLTRYGWTIPIIYIGGSFLAMWLVFNLAKFIKWAGI